MTDQRRDYLNLMLLDVFCMGLAVGAMWGEGGELTVVGVLAVVIFVTAAAFACRDLRHFRRAR